MFILTKDNVHLSHMMWISSGSEEICLSTSTIVIFSSLSNVQTYICMHFLSFKFFKWSITFFSQVDSVLMDKCTLSARFFMMWQHAWAQGSTFTCFLNWLPFPMPLSIFCWLLSFFIKGFWIAGTLPRLNPKERCRLALLLHDMLVPSNCRCFGQTSSQVGVEKQACQTPWGDVGMKQSRWNITLYG